jgi:tRNA A37 threonylcarbamoyladenosine synthetase subunit TsaC/SUA5/YrdC
MRNNVVTINGIECSVVFGEYGNNRVAIQLVTNSGEPYMTATINIPKEPLGKDEVIIKNFSENEGILQALIASGHISEPVRAIPTGFVYGLVCKLLITPLTLKLNVL